MPIVTISDTTWAGVNAPPRESRLHKPLGLEAGILPKTIRIMCVVRSKTVRELPRIDRMKGKKCLYQSAMQ
jgi:hypothetical protein